MQQLKGKNIWIIGASSGIGAALAKQLSSVGTNVIISARNASKLEEVQKTLHDGQHALYPLDITDYQKAQDVFKAIKVTYKQLDSIIFMAGIYNPGKLEEHDISVVKQIAQINFVGALHIAHLAIPFFKEQKFGQLVLCSSVAGYRGLPNSQPYGATKAALNNLAESLRAEHQASDLDIKLICPGFVATELTAKNDFPMPFIITPEEAAERIAKFLPGKCFCLDFPKRFTVFIRLLRILPCRIYFWLMKYAR